MSATQVVPVAAKHSARAGTPDRKRRTGAALAVSGFPVAGLVYVACYRHAVDGGSLNSVHALFWGATAIALATAAATYALAANKRSAAVGITVALAILLSLPKFLRAPSYFNFYDELAHWRATDALLGGGRLFAENALNKVVADYPGLHLVTAGAAALTGGSVFAAGTLVVLAARVAGCLAVYLLAQRIPPGGGVGLAAVLLFAANPTFGFFDAQFAYESLALPLVAIVLLLALRGYLLLPAILSIAVVVTHHASSYVLTALLVAAAAARRRGWALAATAGVATVVWLLVAARYTLTYIGPYVESNLTSIPQFVSGSNRPRRLFGGFLPIPGYERVASFLAVLVLFGLFAAAVWMMWRRRMPWVLVVLGGLYFVSLPLVALRGDQVAKRVWEFAFLGLAPVAAVALSRLANGPTRTTGTEAPRTEARGTEARGTEARGTAATRATATTPAPARAAAAAAVRAAAAAAVRAAAAAAAVVVVFVGCAAARSGEHIRFPGPYLPSADPRSATPDVVAAARWMRGGYGEGGRVAGDRTLAAILGSYGAQAPITYQENGQPIWRVFQAEEMTPEVVAQVRGAGLGWLAVDLRTAGVFPLTGFYFDESEPGAYVDTQLTGRGLTKFDDGYQRVYDNGHVLLYRVVVP